MSTEEHNSPQDLPTKEVYKEIDFSDKDRHLLSCPKCKHFISGDEINIEKTIAKCGHCNHVFGFEHDSTTSGLKPTQLSPEGIEVLKLRSELDIRLKWKHTTPKAGRWFYLFFTGMWNLILMPIVITMILTGMWGILLFLSAHLAVGLGLIWHLATIYTNQTSISVTRNKIRLRTFPFRSFLFKKRDIDTSDLKQLYVSKYVQSTTNGNPNYAYALYAILNSGEKVSLVRGMNFETQKYVEKEIEAYLDIPNKKVEEEAAA